MALVNATLTEKNIKCTLGYSGVCIRLQWLLTKSILKLSPYPYTLQCITVKEDGKKRFFFVSKPTDHREKTKQHRQICNFPFTNFLLRCSCRTIICDSITIIETVTEPDSCGLSESPTNELTGPQTTQNPSLTVTSEMQLSPSHVVWHVWLCHSQK